MMRTPPEWDSNQLFNNADSFGMSFDQAWQASLAADPSPDLSEAERLAAILDELRDHPFAINQPDLVAQVAAFRLRLLGG